jgi:hypothetical protein
MSKARDIANAGTALATVDATELGYLDGVTSAIQTQVDAKLATATASTTYVPNTLTTTLVTSSTHQVLTHLQDLRLAQLMMF